MMNSNNKNQKGLPAGQAGSIIIFTVLMVGSILSIALTLAAVFLPKVRTLTNAGSNSIGAIYAADSALEWCLYISRGNPAFPAPTMANGATYTITPTDCTVIPLNHQVVGTYRGVSRSLLVNNP